MRGLRHLRAAALRQGRYKSLYVDPAEGLGALCHYIHLNPVRARQCTASGLDAWRWSSVRWLCHPKERPAWYAPGAALVHAGGLNDTTAGRRSYLQYLAWVTEDDVAQKTMAFDSMCRGWVIGSKGFKRDLIMEHRAVSGAAASVAAGIGEAREAAWQATATKLMRQLGKKPSDANDDGKSVSWKLAVAAALKARTTVTNRWLSVHLNMGNLHEVSRKVSAWLARPDPALCRALDITPNPKA